MPQLAIVKDFLRTYADLDKKLRKGVDDALDRFATNYYAAGYLEKLEAACDPRWRTLRINMNHRGVILAPESGDLYLLVTVLPHKEAYRHIRNRRPSVNQALGVLEFRDETALDTMSSALVSETPLLSLLTKSHQFVIPIYPHRRASPSPADPARGPGTRSRTTRTWPVP